MFSLNNLYWYYQKDVRSKTEIQVHAETTAETKFGSLVINWVCIKLSKSLILSTFFKSVKMTSSSIFWALFGLGNQSDTDLSPFNNSLTENYGQIIYGSYHITAIIILLNMLIASMTQSYERILVSLIIDDSIQKKFSELNLCFFKKISEFIFNNTQIRKNNKIISFNLIGNCTAHDKNP